MSIYLRYNMLTVLVWDIIFTNVYHVSCRIFKKKKPTFFPHLLLISAFHVLHLLRILEILSVTVFS